MMDFQRAPNFLALNAVRCWQATMPLLSRPIEEIAYSR